MIGALLVVATACGGSGLTGSPSRDASSQPAPGPQGIAGLSGSDLCRLFGSTSLVTRYAQVADGGRDFADDALSGWDANLPDSATGAAVCRWRLAGSGLDFTFSSGLSFIVIIVRSASAAGAREVLASTTTPSATPVPDVGDEASSEVRTKGRGERVLTIRTGSNLIELGCSPACVVDELTAAVEVLLPPR